MNVSPRPELVRCANEVAEALRAVFHSLSTLEAHIHRLWEDSTARGGHKPLSKDFTPLAVVAREQLLDCEVPTYGTGMVFAPWVLRDYDLHLEWWQLVHTGRVQRLKLDLNPASERYYDYTTMEWFHVPRDENRSIVVGPYVDLHGAGTYIFTFSCPVFIGDIFAGIVGADVSLADIERHLTVPLKELADESLIVTTDGRVLAANTPRWIPGMLYPQPFDASASNSIPIAVDAVRWQIVETLR